MDTAKTGIVRKLCRALHWRAVRAYSAKRVTSKLTAPIVSITFDDFPKSALDVGGAILESVGARGTYFTSAAFSLPRMELGSDRLPNVQYFEPDDIAEAVRRGHEIGCHTFDHPNVSTLSMTELATTIAKNAEFLRGLIGDYQVESFAYPRGLAGFRSKRWLARRFTSCRGTLPGVNHGSVDLSQLKCVDLAPHSLARQPMDRLVEHCIATNGWLIFDAHDISAAPSRWGCTPALLQSLVALLSRRGVEILPVRDACARLTGSVIPRSANSRDQ